MKDPTIRKIYNQLRNDLTFGKFRPGEHLREKQLTEEYSVSRASIREIIGQLASQGYLTVEPNRGAVVTKLSLEDIDITYQILVRCESLAASLFAKNPDKKSIKNLKSLHEQMQKNVVDSRSYLQLNDLFHEIIFMNCGNSILKDLIYHTRLRIYRYKMVETKQKIIEFYNDQHEKILSAISNADEKLAESVMIQHLESARKNRLEAFRKFGQFL